MNRKHRGKPTHQKVIRINISLPPGIVMAGERLLMDGGYHGFSDYFASKIRRDAKLDPEDKVAA